MSRAYYNEFDPYVAAWLRNLITEGLIAPGDVDERSIVDVRPSDLNGYTQCHFFAGIGGWSLALRLAGWDDRRPVWTGSCPCQPFSAAGRGLGEADERHLWPEFRRLIAECAPAVVFGEQVASRAGRQWLARVRADLEALGYGVGAADLCAAGVGAPHIRQRLWWVADANERQCGRLADGEGREHDGQATRWQQSDSVAQPGGAASGLANPDQPGQREQRRGGLLDGERPACGHDADGCGESGLGDTSSAGLAQRIGDGGIQRGAGRAHEGQAAQLSGNAGAWSNYVWLPCADGKARRIEPGLEPLVAGLPLALDGLGPISRVGTLKGAGNAIVPAVAARFIGGFMERSA